MRIAMKGTMGDEGAEEESLDDSSSDKNPFILVHDDDDNSTTCSRNKCGCVCDDDEATCLPVGEQEDKKH